VLNGNIFRFHDLGVQKYIKYPGLNGKVSNAETEIKINFYTENFQSSGMIRVEEF
jgi:hypothetical protein